MRISYEQLPLISFLLKLFGLLIAGSLVWIIYRAKKDKKLTDKQIYQLVLIGIVTAIVVGFVTYFILGPIVIKPFIYGLLGE